MSPLVFIILLAYIGLIVLIIITNARKAGVIVDRILFFITAALFLFSYISFLIEPLQIDPPWGGHHSEPTLAIRDSVFYPLPFVFLLIPLMIAANLKDWNSYFPIFPILKTALLVLFIVFSVYLFHNYHDMDTHEWCRQFDRLGGNG